MKIAKTPGFTADASLYAPRTSYRGVVTGRASNIQMVPQLIRQPVSGTSNNCAAFCAAKANECTGNCSPSDSACRDGCDSLFWCCLAGCGLMTGGGGLVMQ